MVARVLRSPALHFLCLGACLLALDRRLTGSSPPPAASDDELLYQSALALGADTSDPAVRERLARLGAFVGEDQSTEADLEAEARRLGLARSDVVVRRHLIHMMHLAAGRLRPEDYPSDDELAARASTLAVPERVRFTQVYVSRARHGDSTEADAARLLAELVHDGVGADRGPALGDAFPVGAEVGPATAADVDRRMGPGFAAALTDVAPGAWAGPIRSPYGLHLVWVHERLPAAVPALASVRGQLLHTVLHERSQVRAQERIAALRAAR